MWIAISLLVVAVLFFFVIARKGRRLRTVHILPPEAHQAYLEARNGEKHPVQITSEFYIGRKPDSNVVIENVTHDYEVCIFYHRKRFAFQVLSGKEVMVNDETQIAGYLSDGDVLKIAGESFVFRIYS